MKIKNYALTLLVLILGFYSCGSDDDDDVAAIVIIDRDVQYMEDLESIEEFLSTHYYNYEEFEADPSSSTFQIEFDTTAVDINSDKIALIDHVNLHFKIVEDFEGVEYKLYYLKVREGLGDTPTFGDSTLVKYNGTLLNQISFDSSSSPTWFQLPNLVQGFRETIVEFNGASGFDDMDNDGVDTFYNFGIGAMFIPSGLGYFNAFNTGIPSYSPLIFTFDLLGVNDETDSDNDGISNIHEDLDDNRNLYSDDTDADFTANFLDTDDDGDGTLTKYEDLEPDSDLEVDRDGDGDPTNDFGDLDPTNDDDDNDGIPNYLDSDSTISNQDL